VPYATARTVSLTGATGHVVDVQADVAPGLVATAMVGRPDASITEGRDRCRSAVVNSGFDWPNTRRVTILLSPADLPKRGPHFDLAIAVAVLAADEVIPAHRLDGLAFVGELTLDGRLRAVPGVLPMVMAAAARGIRTVFVPEPHVEEAALVPDVHVFGVRSLRQVVAELRGEDIPEAPPVEPLSVTPLLAWRGEHRTDHLDLADVHGMTDARYACEVAAAGGHHLMLSGPKGSGKTTLAERLPGLLPDLSLEESLELAAVHSLAGTLTDPALMGRPPFRAPHHSATKASLLGGGSGRVHPGEMSRALHGVLFLDEFPLFTSDIIEALRQPLESGEVTIARGDEVATYPARTMFVLACNPCPCGDFSASPRDNRCTCTEVRRRQYRARMSGPIVDRLDITRHIEPVRPHELRDRLSRPEPTVVVRERVARARDRQRERYAGTPWRLNADVPGPVLHDRWPLASDGRALLDERLYSGRLTRRGATRVHRLAWSVLDLAECPGGPGPTEDARRGGSAGADPAPSPGAREVDVALRLRLGEPLLDATLRRPSASPDRRAAG
jgi:magnesium chelatase family protein